MLERDFLLALHLTPGIGRVREQRVIAAIESERVPRFYPWSRFDFAYALREDESKLAFIELFDDYQKTVSMVEESLVIGEEQEPFITYFDQSYPPLLRESFQPPLILFYRGDLRALDLPLLSVVGTRNCTQYGLDAMRHLLPEVIEKGVGVVSGLAKGIDVMAHQTTFSAGGVAIGVVAAGLKHAYPYENRFMQEEVSQRGLLLSEYPGELLANRGHFPERNRIIAGLSAATLVVEARKKSGSLITANLALQNNRDVLAVPGSILSLESEGCNTLIEAGALPACSPSAIMRAVKLIN
ncbi:DNA-protecting protein DprA [Fructobacillus sp. M2-14]|uniref:DNA-protecting protein DprA n=1 Tax=Fructobacillus broussonetiae TaxID=2713173 RepID=A0ABS5R0U4_9LACO|nr:DNA-processing protein DprA [Fructobacillus broussonetiae]MBS9338236.1 DNA-protecting protein DprA [Fructobacillus broussonetiae]